MNRLPSPGQVVDWAVQHADKILVASSLTLAACSGGGTAEGPSATALPDALGSTPGTSEPLGGTSSSTSEVGPSTTAVPKTTTSTTVEGPLHQSDEVNWRVPVQTFAFDPKELCKTGVRANRPSPNADPYDQSTWTQGLRISADSSKARNALANGSRVAIAWTHTPDNPDQTAEMGLLPPGKPFVDPPRGGREIFGVKVGPKTICAGPVIASLSADGQQVRAESIILNTGYPEQVAAMQADKVHVY